jgi:hypothetical protein
MYTEIGTFGMQIYHLATLIYVFVVNNPIHLNQPTVCISYHAALQVGAYHKL